MNTVVHPSSNGQSKTKGLDSDTRHNLPKILEKHDWVLLRAQGSHYIYGKAGSEIRISLPIHRNQSLKTGLLRHFMKVAGLTESDL